MIEGIKVIAFDIDGTLYPAYRLNVRIVRHFFANALHFLHFGLIRRQLRRTAPLGDLFEYQARLLGERIKMSSGEAMKLLDDMAYTGLAKYFKTIKPFKDVPETFAKLKEAGYRLALLSDFPPEQKGDLWGLKPYCEKILSTEKIGALKPEEILYVGNSVKYDIYGAKNAGMKTAYLEPLWRRVLHRPLKAADISFGNYRQFQKIALE